jgi:iron complex transport system permease protein
LCREYMLNKNIIILLLLSISILIAAPFLGMNSISLPFIFKYGLQADIFWSLRVPRVATAFFAGGGLSLCGMVFQAVFRNPLADPFTLGVSSGASCGAALMILTGATGAVLGIPVISVGALAGGVISMSLVYSLSSLNKSSSNLTMLLAGVAVSFLFSSLLMLVQYLSNLRDSFQIVRWLMGGIEVFGFKPLLSFLPVEVMAAILILFKLPELDHLLTGEDIAQSRGVNVKSTKNILLVASTLMIGCIVAVCGPIGFIGLMIPHICRSFFSSRHVFLGPVVFLTGGIFLVVCDTASRIIIAPAEMPVGVITALMGAPFILWILFSKDKLYFG